MPLDDATLVATMRKPFDVLAEGLQMTDSRGDRRLTFPNDISGKNLLWLGLTQRYSFTADAFFSLGRQFD